MSLSVNASDFLDLKPRVFVMGVGGAGGNAINNMIKDDLQGVSFVVCNTDSQALSLSEAETRIQIGAKITQGLGAGADPEIGRQSAEDSIEEIMDSIDGAHMLFITAGMGGGTGTGAASVIAEHAKMKGILTVAVVTKPFDFEGRPRSHTAEEGLKELIKHVDTLIVIPNQNLFRISTEKTTFSDAFTMADTVLTAGVKGITDLMVRPGVINLDFADVRSIMQGQGYALIGSGESNSECRSEEAAKAALTNPLIEDLPTHSAKGVLINITGGPDMTLYEIDTAANIIRSEVDPDANILLGYALEDDMDGFIRVSIVATGLGDIGLLNAQVAEEKNASSQKIFESRKTIMEDHDSYVKQENSDTQDCSKINDKISDILGNLEDVSVPTFFRKSRKKKK